MITWAIKILFTLELLWPTVTFSQDVIKVDVLPSKISGDVKMIIHSEQTMVLERYHFFKHIFWVSTVDTLEILENGMLKSKSGVVIDPTAFKVTVSRCDSVVNRIRNSAFQEKMSSQLRNIARKEIGYDSKEIADSLDILMPAEFHEATMCHDEFKEASKKWFDKQRKKIDEVKKKKIERREWIKINPDKIDKDFIKSFLMDYGTSVIDQAAILDIVKFKTGDFLSVCKDMVDGEFFTVKLKLSLLPDSLVTNEVIGKIKESKIKTNRKSILVKKLKKKLR